MNRDFRCPQNGVFGANRANVKAILKGYPYLASSTYKSFVFDANSYAFIFDDGIFAFSPANSTNQDKVCPVWTKVFSMFVQIRPASVI